MLDLLDRAAVALPRLVRKEGEGDQAEFFVPHPSDPTAEGRGVVWQTLRSIGGINEDRLLGACLRYARAEGLTPFVTDSGGPRWCAIAGHGERRYADSPAEALLRSLVLDA